VRGFYAKEGVEFSAKVVPTYPIGVKSISTSRHYWAGWLNLPVVQVSVWAGMSEENKKKVVEGMTRVLMDLGIPRDAVTVIIYEAPKANWATGGQLHSEKYPKI
jgi:4-oxalocrotonate tautomerase